MPKLRTKKIKAVKPSSVPYVSGFRPPTLRKQTLAVGDDPPKEFRAGEGFFDNIPECTSIDDWLAQYREEGQSYNQFLYQCPWFSTRKIKFVKAAFQKEGKNILEKYPDGKIYVLPLGDFDPSCSPDFDALVEYAELFLCIPVRKLPPVKLYFEGEDAYFVKSGGKDGRDELEYLNSRYDKKTKRRQLRVDTGLLQLRDYMPEDGLMIITLTMSDLYCDKTDLFVAGIASGNKRSAIFTLHRYDPNLTFSGEFWHEVTTTKDVEEKERIQLILERSCRLLVHELGHLLGIDHCIYYSCLMNGSGHLEEDFRQPNHLCPVDLRKLHCLTNFDIVERYLKLKEFYDKHGFKKESDWIEKRLGYIQEI